MSSRAAWRMLQVLHLPKLRAHLFQCTSLLRKQPPDLQRMSAGTKRERYLAENLAAASVKLTPEDMRAIEAAVPLSQVRLGCDATSAWRMQAAGAGCDACSSHAGKHCMSHVRNKLTPEEMRAIEAAVPQSQLCLR